MDSQIGPSTRTVGHATPSGHRIDGAAQRGERHDRVLRAVEGRAGSSSVIPASSTISALGAVADVEDAAHQPAAARHDRTAGLDGQPGRSRVRGKLRAAPRRPPRRSAPARAPCPPRRSRRGSPNPRRACRSRAGRPRCEVQEPQSEAGRPARQASTAPSWEPMCRWIPRHRSGPSTSAARRDDLRQLLREGRRTWSRPHPPPAPRWVSGCTSGLTRTRTSGRTPAPAASAGQGGGLVRGFEADPQQRRAAPPASRTARAQVPRRSCRCPRARCSRPRKPGARGQRQLAGRHGTRAEPEVAAARAAGPGARSPSAQ